MPTPAERLNKFGCRSQKAVHLRRYAPRLEDNCGNVKQNETVCLPADVFAFVNVRAANQLCAYKSPYCLCVLSVPLTHLLAVERRTEMKRIFHQCDSEAAAVNTWLKGSSLCSC